ncbi:MAG: NAD(P)(+) transhydrogenase (Re/Si-specific) subunit beta [Candidatus Izemoplasmatales bacterium]|nr:NAD(P)(+) transhydrogenase (Re/Si-specific) subunit beta [Candidatus Izemoplasmatales bacterium]
MSRASLPLVALFVLSDPLYYTLVGILTGFVLLGIYFMSKVESARMGNQLSAFAMALAVALTLIHYAILPVWILYILLAIGATIGLIFALKVKMIQMPQLIALLNGLGGLASAIVGGYAYLGIGAMTDSFSQIVALIAIMIGAMTFSGSLVASGKLHRILPQKPLLIRHHSLWLGATILLMATFIVLPQFVKLPDFLVLSVMTVMALGFGLLFSIRVGGADMPITISLLNSLSGVAGAISGLAIGELLLVSIGGIVGASGLLLTQIMCKAMNRSLLEILLGRSTTSSQAKGEVTTEAVVPQQDSDIPVIQADPVELFKKAKDVIIVPGYGMAIAQAQHLVKQLGDILLKQGTKVRFAIHPVAGRMPGHMNVLLAEADVDYDDLYEMEQVNDDFASADLAIVIGANDVINPSARAAEGTPIYGMPILNVDQCPEVFIFNYDLRPGYAGVDNPLYQRKTGVHLFLGNAADTLKSFMDRL